MAKSPLPAAARALLAVWAELAGAGGAEGNRALARARVDAVFGPFLEAYKPQRRVPQHQETRVGLVREPLPVPELEPANCFATEPGYDFVCRVVKNGHKFAGWRGGCEAEDADERCPRKQTRVVVVCHEPFA